MASIQSSLCFNNLKGELDEEVLNCVMQMSHLFEALIKSKELKEEGNKVFRKGCFMLASKLYEKALQFVCVGLPSCEQEASMMTDLAISLNLNLAACCLKVKDFCTVITFCTYVLEFDANNVKAYYRRAMASIQLNLLDDAIKDLKVAVCIDPRNPDVMKELANVEDRLGSAFGSHSKGKAILQPSMDFHSGSSSSRGHCTLPIEVSDGYEASSVPVENIAPLGDNLGFQKLMNANTNFSFSGSHQRAHTSELGQTDGLVDPVPVNDSMDLIVEGASRSEVAPALTDMFAVPSWNSNNVEEEVEHLGNNIRLAKVSYEPSKSNSFDSSIKVCPSNLGQQVHLDEQNECMVGMNTTLDNVSSFRDISPPTPMICVEERADLSPAQSPAFPTFFPKANQSQLPMFQFSKKGKFGQSLRLSHTTYERLSQGKSVEYYNNHGMSHMVIHIRNVAAPNQATKPASHFPQEVDLLPAQLIAEVSTNAATSLPLGHLPLPAHLNGVECEMTNMAPTIGTHQETAITGLPNCTTAAAPLFVFRSSIKSSQHRPLHQLAGFRCIQSMVGSSEDVDASKVFAALWVVNANMVFWVQ